VGREGPIRVANPQLSYDLSLEMKQKAKRAWKHPRMPRVSPEMRQVSEFLLQELLSWPGVTSKAMFGMTAVYRGKEIFGAVPRTRAIGSACAVSFKIAKKTPAMVKVLAAERRIVPPEHKEPKWISFEVQSERDIAGALEWFERAYAEAKKANGKTAKRAEGGSTEERK
jgi:luciferase-like monooxygenase